MMETNILDELVKFHTNNEYVDVIMVALYVCVGYYLKRNFATSWRWPMELKVLVVGTAVSAVYILLALYSGAAEIGDWIKWLFSYTLATSFYEIILKRIPDRSKDKTPGTDAGDDTDLRRDPYGPGL